MNSQKPVFINSVSMANAHGTSTESVWEKVLAGDSSLRQYPLSGEAGNFAWLGQVDHEVLTSSLSGRIRVQTDTSTQVALVLGDRVVNDLRKRAGAARENIGVYLSSVMGGMRFAEQELRNLHLKGPRSVSPYQSFAWFYSATTGQMSIRHSLTGPSGTVVAAECGGMEAIATAVEIAATQARPMLAGAVDGTDSEFGISTELAHPDAFPTSADPDSGFRPFSHTAGGYVPGFGGALVGVSCTPGLSIEGVGSAAIRISGQASGFSAEHDPNAIEAAICIALARADIIHTDVGAVFADGYSTVDRDRAEIEGLAAVFSEMDVPITVPKVGFGRLYSAASASDIGLAALSLVGGTVPPTPQAAVSPSAREAPSRLLHDAAPLTSSHVLVVSTGAGGFISAMVLTRDS